MLYAIRNQSQPPRTVANDKGTFEIVLPDGAELESAQAKGPGGQPIATEASPTSQKNHYALSYPLRPGETQFQVAFHMPYNGEASISPKPVADVQHFVVMTPPGMTFTPKNPQQFQAMPDQPGVMVATNVKPGQDLSFRIAGTGIFQAEGQQGAQGPGEAAGGAMGGGQAAANDNRPGGGLGAPIDAPDPLHEYRAYILGAFALVLVMGGLYVVSKSNVSSPTLSPKSGDKGGASRAASTSPPIWQTTGSGCAYARPQRAAAGGDEGRIVPTGNRSPAGQDQSRGICQGQGRAGRNHQAGAGARNP